MKTTSMVTASLFQNAWIPTSEAMPYVSYEEDDGYSSTNVITKDENGDITIARMNHAPGDWFSILEELEIDTEIEYWCPINEDITSIFEKYEILHNLYGFTLALPKNSSFQLGVDDQFLTDYIVSSCSEKLGMTDKPAFYKELVCLAYVMHLELTSEVEKQKFSYTFEMNDLSVTHQVEILMPGYTPESIIQELQEGSLMTSAWIDNAKGTHICDIVGNNVARIVSQKIVSEIEYQNFKICS